MASVSVEFSAFADGRFKLLGKLIRKDHFSARARCEAIWMFCIDHNTPVMSKQLVDATAEKVGFAQAMIDAELAEPIFDDKDNIRIKGTHGRIEYLAAARDRQKKATEAAKLKRQEEKEQPINDGEGSDLGTDMESNLESNMESKTDPTLESSSTSASTSTSLKDNTNTYAGNSSGGCETPASEEENPGDQKPATVGGKHPRFDFDAVYEEYPRKDGKQEGLRICKAKIKTQDDYEALLGAVRRYRAQCEREGTEKQYIKHFSTFMHKDRWRDWLEPDAGSSSVVAGNEINWAKVFGDEP